MTGREKEMRHTHRGRWLLAVAAALAYLALGAAAATGADAAKKPPAALATPARNILETIKGLRLEVTLTAPTGERWAVINGENLREGDTIAGLEIIEIQEGKVKLQRGGMSCLLRMD